MGLYWEHNFGFNYLSPAVPEADRILFQRRLETTITSYVDQLYNVARSNLANLITKSTGSAGAPRFFCI